MDQQQAVESAADGATPGMPNPDATAEVETSDAPRPTPTPPSTPRSSKSQEGGRTPKLQEQEASKQADVHETNGKQDADAEEAAGTEAQPALDQSAGEVGTDTDADKSVPTDQMLAMDLSDQTAVEDGTQAAEVTQDVPKADSDQEASGTKDAGAEEAAGSEAQPVVEASNKETSEVVGEEGGADAVLDASDPEQAKAAQLIQNRARQRHAKAVVEEKKASTRAATMIQSKARQRQASSRVLKLKDDGAVAQSQEAAGEVEANPEAE